MSELCIRATPFHGRAAASNPFNRWTVRNGFTLAKDYGDAHAEALAARTTLALLDASWRWRIFVNGSRAAECLSCLMTKDVTVLSPGQSLKALWLNDAGAVRGAGVVARYADDQFLVVSAATDMAWFMEAARQFDLSLRDMTDSHGGVAIVGPYADTLLKAISAEALIAPFAFRRLFWQGVDLTVSRWGEHRGFEIWCAAQDAFVLWDRLRKLGAPYGIRPAGLDAADILDIEAGAPRPGRDYRVATDGFAASPAPQSLALESLIDETQVTFNGRRAWLAARKSDSRVLVGIEIDSEAPTSFAPLMRSGAVAGQTFTSVYSPVLCRAIALAQVEKSCSASGTEFSLTPAASFNDAVTQSVAARVVELPFVASAEVP
jgi:aminomethyltransferase